MSIVNTRLLAHPLNWFTVLLMLIIAGMFGHYLLLMFDQEPSLPRVTSNTTQVPITEGQISYAT